MGEYGPESVCLNMKYTNEIRLCVGVAKVELDSGQIIGRRAKTYSYSGKVLLSKKQYDAKIQAELKRVRNLPVGNDWIINNRPPDTIYANDDVGMLNKVAKERNKI